MHLHVGAIVLRLLSCTVIVFGLMSSVDARCGKKPECAVTDIASISGEQDGGELDLNEILSDDGEYFLSTDNDEILTKQEIINSNRSIFPDNESRNMFMEFIAKLQRDSVEDSLTREAGDKKYTIFSTLHHERDNEASVRINILIESFLDGFGWVGSSHIYMFRCEDGVLRLYKITQAG